MKVTALVVLLASTLVEAHYKASFVVYGGQSSAPWEYTRKAANYQSNGPVTDVKSAAFSCYQLTPGGGGTTKTLNVTAGQTFAQGWEADISHPGVASMWLSKVPAGETAATYDGNAKQWFKIWQDTPTFTGGKINWADQGAKTTPFKIPSCIAPGEYLLRAEHVGLHSAGSAGGAQFYIGCTQISVSGGTGTAKPEQIAIPGFLSADDPAIKINIYYPVPTSYKNWGPAPLTC